MLSQYVGYLRRNPNDLPDTNYTGFDFWPAKLDSFSLPGEDVRDERVALARASTARRWCAPSSSPPSTASASGGRS